MGFGNVNGIPTAKEVCKNVSLSKILQNWRGTNVAAGLTSIPRPICHQWDLDKIRTLRCNGNTKYTDYQEFVFNLVNKYRATNVIRKFHVLWVLRLSRGSWGCGYMLTKSIDGWFYFIFFANWEICSSLFFSFSLFSPLSSADYLPPHHPSH